ncbi:MAG: hypothetical protein PHU85_18445 [Phycisphaerae bacterium]|nr:hypothetical protein [Phycisphaerae bacterium]
MNSTRVAHWSLRIIFVMLGMAALVWAEGSGWCVPTGVIGALGILVLIGLVQWFSASLGDRARSALSLLALGVGVTVFAGTRIYQTRPSRLFASYVASNRPISVHIKHGEYSGGLDTSVFLHFTIDASDFATLLAEKYVSRNGHLLPGRPWLPDWWHPERLDGLQFYQRDKEAGGGEFWVNATHTEVYFAHRS